MKPKPSNGLLCQLYFFLYALFKTHCVVSLQVPNMDKEAWKYVVACQVHPLSMSSYPNPIYLYILLSLPPLPGMTMILAIMG